MESGDGRRGGGGVTWHGVFLRVPPRRVFWRGGCLHADDAISPPACQSQAARVPLPPPGQSLSECDCGSPWPSGSSLGDQGTAKPVKETASCHSHFSFTLG